MSNFTAIKTVVGLKFPDRGVPRWCDVRCEDGDFPSAPTEESIDDAVALRTIDGVEYFTENCGLDEMDEATVQYWMDGRPVSADAEVVCYF